jgi:hypothetical protein
MTAGRGDLERALGALLSLDVGEIEGGSLHLQDFGPWPREHLRALEMIGELYEGSCRNDLDVRAGPGRFRSAGCRAHQALAARVGTDGGGKHAGDRRDRAIEAEFAEHGEARDGVMRNGADGRHQPKRDRQVVVTAFFRQVGGRKIDGDTAGRQRQA